MWEHLGAGVNKQLYKIVMCEWLSSGEWCDVHLVCGGQILRSHRLILASASAFLKDLLLSCPLEETPTFIFLPEFDIGTLSLVLYYVYNGEVVVQNRQMKTFLELINTMQIFVESQYLSQISRFKQDCHYDFNNFYQANASNHCSPMFVCANDNHKQFYKLKRNTHCYNMIRNLHGTYSSNRQKLSFSRDAFVKTLSGNSNGIASSVLAIANEHYHEPTSLFSTFVNADIVRPKTISECLTLFDDKAKKYDESYYISKTINGSTSQDLDQNKLCADQIETEKKKSNDFRDNCRLKKKINIISCIEQDLTQINSKLLTNMQSDNNISLSKIPFNEQEFKSKTKNRLTRVTILNEVMQSPWTPILPYNFRPLRRRDHKVEQLELDEIQQLNNRNENALFTSTVTNLKEKIFSNNDAVDTQMRQHSHYTCVECDKSFSQLRNFKYHMSVHRGTKEFAATCSVCGKCFNDGGYLSSHMKIHRNRKEYKCTLCPKSFNQRVAYNMHVRIHTGVKPHVCDDCGKAFSRKMLLKQHQRTHSGERPYACSYCDKRFADRSNMTLHLRLHTGIKPFICNLCPKAFTKKHHLKSHLNFHTGDKPYICPRCKLAFTQSSNMRTHYKKCNAEPTNEDI